MKKVSFAVLLLSLSWRFTNAFQLNVAPSVTKTANALGASLSSSEDYLSSISAVQAGTPSFTDAPRSSPVQGVAVKQRTSEDVEVATFTHASFSFFAPENMTAKGPRKNADVGQPHDATRSLVEVKSTSTGSWWCAEGGWPSPALRETTEVFYVFSGHGCVTDTDGMKHFFGPGDTVVLPKGWSGRWDIMEPIHKVWVVHDHPVIEETSNPIRAVITSYNSLSPQYLNQHGARPDVTHGAPVTASRTVYDVGPTKVGCWTCTPGSFRVVSHATTFHLLEGIMVITNTDGSGQRCVPGDTVVFPRGWTGHWDIIETVKKLWVVVE